MLKFNDGVNIDTSGQLRILRLRDGYYVVGEGWCIPVDSREDGKEVLEDMSKSASRHSER